MKTLYFECRMGAAGDMVTAALYELLSEEQKALFLEKMNHLMPEVQVHAMERVRSGITGTGMEVLIHGEEEAAGEDADHAHTHDHEHHHHDEDHDHEHHHHDDEDHDHEHHHHDDGHDHEHHHHDDEHHHDHEHAHHHDHDHEHHHDHTHPHVHRGLPEIQHMIESFDLPQEVRDQAMAVYRHIAEAESAAHGRPVEEVHFHEVGALDAVADVTGACYALYLLHPDQVLVSPINVGNGTVRAAHGILPVPAPATAFLLKEVPSYMNPDPIGELCTPTGAALLRTFADGYQQMPVMQVEQIGYGMGKKEFDRLNGVRVFYGEQEIRPEGPNQQICQLSANLDDMTAEELGYASEQLLAAGALDVYTVAATMKKSRPGVVFSCLCKEADQDRMAALMLRYTTSFGVRVEKCDRYAMDIHFEKEETPYGTVTKKTGTGYGVTKSKYEYEDLAKLARERETSIREIREAKKV